MPKKPSRQELRKIELAKRHRINAGRVAIKGQTAFFGRQFAQVASEWKADDTRVTFADFAISENLFADLRRDFPEDDYCSEEASPQDEVLQMDAKFAWMIDPVDGTNNYALGFPVCAISLALLQDGEPIYGFIYDFATRTILEGGPGHGIFRDQKRLNRDTKAAEAQTMLGLHYPMPLEQLNQLNPLLAKYRVRSLGSATVTAALVATGYLSGCIDFKVKAWDIAAAYALCLGVGLSFEFIEESPFPLTSFHPEIQFCPYFVGTEEFRAEVRQLLRRES